MIPTFALGDSIPKIIHRVYSYPYAMPDVLAAEVNALPAANPQWDQRVYDMSAMEAFITQHYGAAVLSRFLQIDSAYGAARADLFRYLAIYKCGGIYLDIKSTFLKPIDEVIKGDESFIISHWDNAPGEQHENWGLHKELPNHDSGEFQQWHVIAAPGHPYLKRTITNVLSRIEAYRPWRDNMGWLGVMTLTGPIAYTQDIAPILDDHPHTLVRDHRELGLQYSIFTEDNHKKLSARHYVNLAKPVVNPPGIAGIASRGYALGRAVKRLVTGKDVAAA